MYDDVRHIYFMSWGSYPVYLVCEREYRVLETRVRLCQEGKVRVLEMYYLVEEVAP